MNIEWVENVALIVEECDFPRYRLIVRASEKGMVYLQATYYDADIATGAEDLQHTRRWLLSPEMTKSEIVATAFKCVMTSMEHKTREWFKYRGQPIYQPHYDVDALYEICERRDVRKPAEA